MTRLAKTLVITALSLSSALSFAVPPSMLISHNKIDVESQAYLGPNLDIPQQPTAPGGVKKVSWVAVRVMCMNTPKPGICPAKIKVNTTPHTTLGVVEMNLNTGEITPTVLSKNGYTMTVLNPGEIEFTKAG